MNEVYDYLIKDSGIKSNDTVVIGVSGGPDSMSLLYIMNEIKKEMNLNIVCAHINHNVRKESEQEQIDLNNWCDKENVIFECMKIENYGDDNFHNEARTIRYNYFDKLCKKYNAKFLLTAHHSDDLMETILMRIVRGSTLKGYSGFKKVVDKGDYKIIRPFIGLTKAYIEKYAIDNNIHYAIDKSNFKDCYTRNRYRKNVLPFLKREDENVHLKFLKFSETLIEYNDYIDKEVSKIMNSVFQRGVININNFIHIDHLLQVKLIYNILEHIYGDDLIIISDIHVNLIIDLIMSQKANSLVNLPNNVKAVKSYNEVSFQFDDDVNDTYEIEINEVASLPSGRSISKVESCDITNNYVIRLNSKNISLPLIVRTRRNGDKIEVKGMLGRKKVNDIFIDNKISTVERDSWPIVLDSKGTIVWVPGLKKSRFDKDLNEEYDIILRYD